MLKLITQLIILNLLYVVSYFQGFLDAKSQIVPYWSKIGVFIVSGLIIGAVAGDFFKRGYDARKEENEKDISTKDTSSS